MESLRGPRGHWLVGECDMEVGDVIMDGGVVYVFGDCCQTDGGSVDMAWDHDVFAWMLSVCTGMKINWDCNMQIRIKSS